MDFKSFRVYSCLDLPCSREAALRKHLKLIFLVWENELRRLAVPGMLQERAEPAVWDVRKSSWGSFLPSTGSSAAGQLLHCPLDPAQTACIVLAARWK